MIGTPDRAILGLRKEGKYVGKSRISKLRTQPASREADVFFMSLEEAKQAIADKYDFLQDRYERSKQAKKRSA